MGIKNFVGKLIGEKETPVYKAENERNRDVRTYQLFLMDYSRLYGKVDAEFVATAENAPSYRLWLAGRDRGIKDSYASLPDDVKARFKPAYSSTQRPLAPLPDVYNAVKQGRLAIEPAAYALGFDSNEGFIQVMQTLDGLLQENLTLKNQIAASTQTPKPVDFTSGTLVRKRRRVRIPDEPQGEQGGLVGGTITE